MKSGYPVRLNAASTQLIAKAEGVFLAILCPLITSWPVSEPLTAAAVRWGMVAYVLVRNGPAVLRTVQATRAHCRGLGRWYRVVNWMRCFLRCALLLAPCGYYALHGTTLLSQVPPTLPRAIASALGSLGMEQP